MPVENGKIVCDILAIRRDGGRCTPILLELKNGRQLTRLLAQVQSYAALVDEHAELFAELFSALLGEVVRFDVPAEKGSSGHRQAPSLMRKTTPFAAAAFAMQDTRCKPTATGSRCR